MTPCFVDAYYFFAVLNKRDEAHAGAVRLHVSLRRPLVTSAWVLTEVADGLASARTRGLFSKLLERLQSDPRFTLVQASHDLFTRGVQLYASRPDKSWSLTDCISFVVMRDQAITDALTADRHFEQAGFIALLKDDSSDSS